MFVQLFFYEFVDYQLEFSRHSYTILFYARQGIQTLPTSSISIPNFFIKRTSTAEYIKSNIQNIKAPGTNDPII